MYRYNKLKQNRTTLSPSAYPTNPTRANFYGLPAIYLPIFSLTDLYAGRAVRRHSMARLPARLAEIDRLL
jgi:hypothetical protein